MRDRRDAGGAEKGRSDGQDGQDWQDGPDWPDWPDRKALLARIEAYYDAVPRAAAAVETLGPFTLFVKQGAGWPYYARPSLGATAFTAADVERVRARQRALGVPEAFEWVAATTPGLEGAAAGAGLAVGTHPLLVLEADGPRPCAAPPGVELRLAGVDDDLALLGAVAHVAFGAGGTAVGPQGPADLLARAAGRRPEEVAFERERMRAGRTVMAVALAGGQPVSVGSHQPVGSVSEVVGVGTLPAFRRRGIAASLTAFLAADARRRGVATVFLSAGDDDVARVYGRVGFRRIATACAAEPPS
jgi:GNAT superfamily N-acetyltransferase